VVEAVVLLNVIIPVAESETSLLRNEAEEIPSTLSADRPDEEPSFPLFQTVYVVPAARYCYPFTPPAESKIHALFPTSLLTYISE